MKRRAVPAVWLLPVSFLVGSAAAAEWQPVSPSELSQKAAKVEPGADSEAIFWDVRVKDEVVGGRAHTILAHDVRIKVFNERGRDRWRTISISVPNGTNVSDVAARTVHPDGSEIEVAKDAFHEQNSFKSGNSRIKQISWAMPAVEGGSIIEYRYIERRENRYAHYVRLDFQLFVPAQVIRYWIKPYVAANFRYQMMMQDFQCPHTVERQADGFYLATLSNVPAFRREPSMPPDDQVRAWSLVYYRPIDRPKTFKFWNEYGRTLYSQLKGNMKISKEIHAKAAEITSTQPDDARKLEALSSFCRSHIRNTLTDAVSAEERADADRNKNPEDTLSQGMGTTADIEYLFTALATAAGFDARVARLTNRNGPPFDPDFTDAYFMRDTAVAVKLDGGWHFYEPAAAFIPHDMIASQHEGVTALISDPKEPELVQTPVSTAAQNVTLHQASLRLADDGSIEGNLHLQFTGHLGAVRKQNLLRQSDAQREESVKNEINRTVSSAEISDLKIENATDPEKPLTFDCKVRVPGYAQRTGKRLFFAPEFFRQAQTSRFPNKDRKYPVYIPFAETEEDRVSIDIPPGFTFDEPKVPAAIALGDSGKYEVKAQIQGGTRLVYIRTLTLSRPGGMRVPVSSYPVLKSLFDRIAQADQQTFALKAAPAAPSTTSN